MSGRSDTEWRLVVGAVAGVLGVGLGLIVALALGWNNPRPQRSPDWQAQGLPLTLTALADEPTALLLGRDMDDGTFEVVAAPVAGDDFNAYGLLYRAHDEQHGYVFAVGSDGYFAVLELADGAETPLVDWQQFPHIHRGRAANRLRVTCAGTTCQYTINDEYATTVKDDSYTSGQVGLWLQGHNQGALKVEFQRAYVWSQP